MNGITQTGSQNYYSQIASGQKLQSAADGVAEMAIVQGEKAQITGYETGERNAEQGKAVINIADSALDGIQENLQRIRELALQASSSGLMSSDEKQMIQEEINQLKEGISYIAENTQYNTKNLLDGSQSDMHIATSPDGSGMNLKIEDSTLDALGIKDFDVTGKFSITDIDNAIEKVSSNRSSAGAQSNSLDYTIGYNSQTAYNLTAATSKLADTDIEKAVSERDKQKVLQDYQFMLKNKQLEMEKNKTKMFLG